MVSLFGIPHQENNSFASPIHWLVIVIPQEFFTGILFTKILNLKYRDFV
jgi:hypothetical protein